MSYDPTLVLDLAETTLTFGNDNLHWCYVQLTVAEGGNTPVIIASESHIDPLQYWESDGQIHYKIGHFSPVVDGKREAYLLWNGKKGGAGASAYVYIAYASAIDGTGFTLTDDPALTYEAIITTTSPITIPVVGDFAGHWYKRKGSDGYTPQKGVDYFDGDDGYTPYVQAGYWYINGVNTGVIAAGSNGRGITSIVLLSTVGLVKTYRITFTDATTFDYTVTDGADGASGETDIFQVHIKFEVAEAETYVCPYACKFTAMIHQQTNAPTLSVALNTNMAQYDNLVITPDAIGLVTLTAQWL